MLEPAALNLPLVCVSRILYSQREKQKYEQHILQRSWENQSDNKNANS